MDFKNENDRLDPALIKWMITRSKTWTELELINDTTTIVISLKAGTAGFAGLYRAE